jgi:hypothetical protein
VIPEAKRYEWLVDCYRLRVDNDYVWGGGNLHGMYEARAMEETGYDKRYENGPQEIIMADLLVFAKLAVKNKVGERHECSKTGRA